MYRLYPKYRNNQYVLKQNGMIDYVLENSLSLLTCFFLKNLHFKFAYILDHSNLVNSPFTW